MSLIQRYKDLYKRPISYRGIEVGDSTSIFSSTFRGFSIERDITFDRDSFCSDRCVPFHPSVLMKIFQSFYEYKNLNGSGENNFSMVRNLLGIQLVNWIYK